MADDKIIPETAGGEHTILVVDDEIQVGQAISRILACTGARVLFADSGRSALETIEQQERPISLILSDQRMPGISGTQLLETVKQTCPDTIRYLMTGYSDSSAVVEAVNKGAIHYYLKKPWDNDELLRAVKTGLIRHEVIMENHRLFRLAKKQTSKLYALNLQLKESARTHKQTIDELDEQIRRLKRQIREKNGRADAVEKITALLADKRLLDGSQLQIFYSALRAALFEQFQAAAERNGFELPRPHGL